MKTTHCNGLWFFLIGLSCLVLLSCQLTQSVLEAATPTTPPTNTPLPTPTETPTPPPTPTETPVPTATDTPTPIPSPTAPPSPTKVPPTRTPSVSKVTVVNNLNQMINISLSGQTYKAFSVRAHSTYNFEIPPGRYAYTFEAHNFYPQTGYIEFPPGPYTWNWGKAKP